MKNIFSKEVTDETIERIKALKADSKPLWGKMSSDQMLAHCNVTYEMVYTEKHPKPSKVLAFFLKNFVKKAVVSEKKYPKSSRTAPQFLISDKQNFDLEQKRLIDYVIKTQSLGKSHFEGKESHSFGKLTSSEWNNLFFKHLDHHLNQFGV